MPVLHQYKGKDEFYILTAIGGTIVTFQLTQEGQHRLKASGIESGSKFGRALLLDLYRNGDAFTHGTGASSNIEQIETGQLALDFKMTLNRKACFLLAEPALHLTTCTLLSYENRSLPRAYSALVAERRKLPT
jgi:hypothetical protein